jgi:uncharacterized protein (TIGR02452 family)
VFGEVRGLSKLTTARWKCDQDAAAFVLEIAAHHRVEHLVLGAWGAGVFRNDPATVARAFADGMPSGAFATVTFAVPGAPESDANHRAFAVEFG